MKMDMKITDGTVNYQVNPIGIEDGKIVFGWKIQGQGYGIVQEAYRILIACAAGFQKEDLMWDSKRIVSSQSFAVPYEGEKLEEQTEYFWKAIVWIDGVEKPYESPIYSFETGIRQESWRGQWIGADCIGEGHRMGKAMPLFRKEFDISKHVKRARAYVSALGQFEFWLNGGKQGNEVLAPAWTDYKKSICYCIYDITESLRIGKNVAGCYLGNGLCRIEGRRYAKFTSPEGIPGICIHISLEFEDGSREVLGSDDSFHIKEGPITYSCFYGGEDYDASTGLEAFTEPNFLEAGWKPAVLLEKPTGRLVHRQVPPVRIKERLEPVSWSKTGDDTCIYDLGKNISGFVRIAASGPRGMKIRVVPGELLTSDGKKVNQEFSGGPHYYEYILSGRERDIFEPKFTYYGFRFVEIQGVQPGGTAVSQALPVILGIEGLMIYTDVRETGFFKCQNPLWNQIHAIILQAMKSNMKSILTDCPHREKLGWLEEAHLMAPSFMYNFDMYSLFKKILADIREAQEGNGLVPNIAPEFVKFEKGFRDSVEWGSAAVILPWYHYQQYGDKSVLEEQYGCMSDYLSYLKSKSQYNIIHDGLGDWCDFGINPPFAQNTPIPVTATAIYCYDLDIMEKISGILGKRKEAVYYREQKAEVQKAFNREYYDKMGQRYATGSQTANSFALFLNLAGQKNREGVLEYLLNDLKKRGCHTTSGDVGYPFLLRALAAYRHQDVIAEMAQKTDCPSYGFQVINGATALCEEWDGNAPGKCKNSQNHFMLGSIEEWFYGGLCGIGGFHCRHAEGEIGIAPYFAKETDWAEAQSEIPQGTIRVYWKREKGEIEVNLKIPPNSRAALCLPLPENSQTQKEWEMYDGVRGIISDKDECTIQISSGEYVFRVKG